MSRRIKTDYWRRKCRYAEALLEIERRHHKDLREHVTEKENEWTKKYLRQSLRLTQHREFERQAVGWSAQLAAAAEVLLTFSKQIQDAVDGRAP